MRRKSSAAALRSIAGVLCLGGLTACPGFGDRVPSGEVTWESDVARIMATACGDCHGEQPSQGAPFPLMTYAQTKPFAERIQVRAYQLRTMPPDGRMSDEDREKLYLWWQAGAPEGEASQADDASPTVDATPTGDAGIPDASVDAAPPVGGEPAPLVPTWDADIEPIITARCAGCHGATLVAGAPYAISTYEETVMHKERVLARAVETDSMPPGIALSSGDQDLLARWIAGGTPR